MKSFRDIELLSAYLDGQLNPSESARLNSRLSSDPELGAAFDELRRTREVLRKLPARKAPRNFLLTRKMVGMKPPLPRAHSAFKFSGAFATVLLLITFAANILAPRIRFGAAAPASEYGYGGGPGLGGGCAEPCGFGPSMQVPAPATEAPVATDAPAMEMQAIPTGTPQPTFPAPIGTLLPTSTIPTETPPPPSADIAREALTSIPQGALPKEAQSTSQSPGETSLRTPAVVPAAWQIGLSIIVLASFLAAFLIDRAVKRKWR